MPARRTSRSRRASPGEVHLTREVHFCAAHRLRNPRFDGKWNREKFGQCSQLHGHNYTFEATVKGVPDGDTGFVIALADLKAVLYEAVVKPCDHCSLEDDVEFMRGVIPSTENLAIAFWRRVEERLPRGVRLHAVRLYESTRSYAEYFGP